MEVEDGDGAAGEVVEVNLLKPLINEKCVDVSKDGNGKLYKEILKEGEAGPGTSPSDGCEVSVHYIGTLPDGTEFDRSDTRGKPFSFLVGEGNNPSHESWF